MIDDSSTQAPDDSTQTSDEHSKSCAQPRQVPVATTQKGVVPLHSLLVRH